ncbi:MAG: serine/threonine kinase [Labilithrix sp.]|nr:serine/threonine kinase [Labilithrix sp.]
MATPGEILKTQVPSTGTSSTELARVFTDDADHAIVQQRLGLLYGVLGAAILLFWVAGVVTALVTVPDRFWWVHLSFAKILHLVAGLGLITIAIICRRTRLLPRWLLSVFDVGGTAKLMILVGAMIAFIPTGIHAEFLILPAVVLVTALRAALVPSPPRWTTLVAAVAALPTPFAAYLSTARDPSWSDQLIPRAVVVVVVTVWSIVAVACAYAIAKVVYGLRAEVKKAMHLGQYTLEDKIGEGGMGAVYRARHALLRRPTAIKLLSKERSTNQDIRRFEREVQLTSMLTHPNTVAVYDFGHTRDGVFYYAMEHLDGISLHDLVERDGPQPSGRVVHILSQIAGALSEAHNVGLVHRDVKPANIFLCERGGIPDFVKVLDFGLVKHVGQADPSLSRADAIAGTPHYMAPESIIDPGSIDARVDLYALGAVGYFLLTGTTVFEGHNLVEICSHHIHSTPEPPQVRLGPAGRVSTELEKVILRCLAKARTDRPRSAGELLALLQTCHGDCAWDLAAAREWWRRERTAPQAAAS